MSDLTDRDILQSAQKLLVDSGLLSTDKAQALLTEENCRQMCSDGSTRKFRRLTAAGEPLCVIAAPAGTSAAELAESRSAWKIGNHLYEKGVPVPELYGWDEDTGVLVFEDLGDMRLHDSIAQETGGQGSGGETIQHYYREALFELARMQISAMDGFDTSWCWDTPRYDVPLMLERESGYFLRAFWQGLLGEKENGGVEEEFRDIAENAGKAPADFFLHRDFQCRNIMVKENTLRFIDFQAGRLGPLGYDVASLLIDPYAALPRQLQEELLAFYVVVIAAKHPGSEKDFIKYYRLLALQRNMQIVGAYAYLSKVRGKDFFKSFIHPALLFLQGQLAESSFAQYRRLRTLVDRGLTALKAA